MGKSLLMLQKLPESLPFMITKIWPVKTANLKKCYFFCENFQNS